MVTGVTEFVVVVELVLADEDDDDDEPDMLASKLVPVRPDD